MTPDDLTAPLGQRKPARPSRKLTLAQLHLIAGVLALSLVVGTGWMFLADNPFVQMLGQAEQFCFLISGKEKNVHQSLTLFGAIRPGSLPQW